MYRIAQNFRGGKF